MSEKKIVMRRLPPAAQHLILQQVLDDTGVDIFAEVR